jgi:hypothetical protein
MPWRIMLQEGIDILRKVEHDDDHHQQCDGEKEGADELFQYV